LAERAEALARAEAACNDERVRLGTEFSQRRSKLLAAAQRLRETRSRLAEREATVDRREAEQAELGDRMAQMQQQLQVCAFERNVLMTQVRELTKDRPQPSPPSFGLERPQATRVRSQRIVFSQDARPSNQVPLAMEECCRTPTAQNRLTKRMRFRRVTARLKENIGDVWGFLNPWRSRTN
jgi:hypothetical protein